MNNKKLIALLIILLSSILLVFVTYKLLMLNKYTIEQTDMNTQTIFNEKIMVDSTIKINDSETLIIDDMSFKNYFTDYQPSKANPMFKVKYNNLGEITSFYSVSSSKQYVELLSFDSFTIFNDEDFNSASAINIDVSEFLKENKIKNDIDLLYYIKNNYYLKNNIFTNTKEMKNNYLLNTFVQVALPEFEKIVLIDGNIRGYIIDLKNNIKEIHVLKETKTYTIILSGEDITNEKFIKELLETISFR